MGSEDAIGESKGERRACERGQAALEGDKVFAFLSSKAALSRARAFLASSSGPRRGQRGERGRRPAPEGPLSLTRCRREKAKKGVGEFFLLRAEVRAQPTFFSSSSTSTSSFTSPSFSSSSSFFSFLAKRAAASPPVPSILHDARPLGLFWIRAVNHEKQVQKAKNSSQVQVSRFDFLSPSLSLFLLCTSSPFLSLSFP